MTEMMIYSVFYLFNKKYKPVLSQGLSFIYGFIHNPGHFAKR